MATKRILFINQEITPYLPETESSRLGRELPRLSQENGFEVRTFMPRFGSVNERRNQLHEVIRLSGVNIPINDTDHPLILKVASMQPSRIQVYFIDNDDFLAKSSSDVDPVGSNRKDNDERIIFFTRGTLETMNKLRWESNVVQCMGWFSALVPLYVKNLYSGNPSFRGSKIVYSIMPGPQPEYISPEIIRKIEESGIDPKALEEFDKENITSETLHKIAMKHSDAVVIGTPDASPALVEYTHSLGVPVVEYDQVKDRHEAYIDLYNSLLENK